MGPGRLELPTSRLSGVRSSQLSYEPDSMAVPALHGFALEVGFPIQPFYSFVKSNKKCH